MHVSSPLFSGKPPPNSLLVRHEVRTSTVIHKLCKITSSCRKYPTQTRIACKGEV